MVCSVSSVLQSKELLRMYSRASFHSSSETKEDAKPLRKSFMDRSRHSTERGIGACLPVTVEEYHLPKSKVFDS
jgi:hypothetical protein